MINQVKRDALRGAETATIDLLAEVLTAEQWAELLNAPLERAVAKGNRGLAQKLVAAGAEVGQAVHEAVLGGHEGIANDLLDGGASTAVKDTIGNSPLHVAAREGKPVMLQLLMLNGAHKDALDELDRTPLCLAVCGGHVGVALALMASGADIGFRFNPRESVVHTAARKGCVGMLRAVIAHGADVNAANNPHRRRALHWAAMYNNVETMGVLVDAGADIEARDRAGATPLYCAAGHVSLEALIVLLKNGADVNATNNLGGRRALHIAAIQNDANTIDVLVDAGADIEACEEAGTTPLHCAAGNVSLEALKVLLKHGADVNKLTHGRQTPLHRAAKKAGTPRAAIVVDLLLRRGADETIVDAFGRTADSVDVVGTDVSGEISLAEDVERVRRLLVNAPADRVWRRRGYLVLCHAHPDRMKLMQESSSASAGMALGTRSSTANGGSSGDWSGVVKKMMELQEKELFRAIVEYL